MYKPESIVWPPFDSLAIKEAPVGSVIESKSPMNYAVDYHLADSDGNIIKDTDYFITSDEAWDRAKELYELSGLEGTVTFRKL